jgi:hypothetical protein
VNFFQGVRPAVVVAHNHGDGQIGVRHPHDATVAVVIHDHER